MAKMTRLATTVTARYYPSTELTDAFYMDGRLTGKRESRSADITTDKEDRGFFYSVFSHATVQGQDPNALPQYEPALRKLYNDVKGGRKTLDDQIGEMVNTAVSVTGRLKIQAEHARSPFFAGVIVKDSEAFAITLGKGLAFLYRDDTLFPMTATDIKIDPVNTQRQKVDHFYNYCATKTATALCSNIAQLRVDDCIILCNREVYDALGQYELLRILYDAEDQCEAAGNVITEAAAKLPNVPLQFMISFVENVSAPEKGGLFGFGRKKNQREKDVETYIPEDEEPTAVPAPIVEPETLATAATVTVAEAVEPLFFGNEPSDPLAEPLAEKPVTPPGPEDPVRINDESMKPFGEPGKITEPEVDEGGFIKTTEGGSDSVKSSVDEAKEGDAEESAKEADIKESVADNVRSKTEAAEEKARSEAEPTAATKEEIKKTEEDVQNIGKEPEEDLEVMKAFADESDERDEIVIPDASDASDAIVTASKEVAFADDADRETESDMGNFDFEGKDTPQYIPDDEDEESAPLLFGDEVPEEEDVNPEYAGDEGEYIDFSEDQIPQEDDEFYGVPETAGRMDGYYIPFDSAQPPEPIGTISGEIPEIPLYDAPSYQPPTYFDDAPAESAYERADSYARGSFDINDEDDDVRSDYPPRPKMSADQDFSFGMPPAPPPTGAQPPRRSPPRQGGAGGPPKRPQGPGGRPRSGDPFDRERGFDYGDPDQKFRKNNMIIYILVGVCALLLIFLIIYGVTQCGSSGNNKETTQATTTTLAPTAPPTTDPPITGETTPTTPGKEPIGVFEFSISTGYRTWWDLFYYVYGIKIDKESDARIATIISYNNLPADYKPAAGDQILLPPAAMLESGS